MDSTSISFDKGFSVNINGVENKLPGLPKSAGRFLQCIFNERFEVTGLVTWADENLKEKSEYRLSSTKKIWIPC